MDDSDFIADSLQASTAAAANHPSTSNPSKKPSNGNSWKPRPTNCLIESDCLFREAEENRCYVCNKDLKHLDELRKALHINTCLDQQEAKRKLEADQQKWAKTVDCPVCGTPLQPGPFRAAHAKNCARKHELSGAQLLSLMDTQTKVADLRKRNGLPHTKLNEPKLPAKKKAKLSKEEPRSEFDEQLKLAVALSASASVDTSEGQLTVPEPKKVVRFRNGRPRSYSFIELEPRSCKCSVFEEIHANFLKLFKIKRSVDFVETMRRRRMRTSALLGDINKCLRKLERLERLADDLNRCSSGSNTDVTIFSLENEAIPVHRFIIAARAPRLLPLINSDDVIPLKDFSAAALRCYIRFLYSASIEWTSDEVDDLLKLATEYGPSGLVSLCQQQQHQSSTNGDSDVDGNGNGIQEADDGTTRSQSPAHEEVAPNSNFLTQLRDDQVTKRSKPNEESKPSSQRNPPSNSTNSTESTRTDSSSSKTPQLPQCSNGISSNKAEVDPTSPSQRNRMKPANSESDTTDSRQEATISERKHEKESPEKRVPIKRRSQRISDLERANLADLADDLIRKATKQMLDRSKKVNENRRVDEVEKAEKASTSDSDDSIVILDHVGPDSMIRAADGKVNKSEDLDIDSGRWLEDLISRNDDSLAKTDESYGTTDCDPSKPFTPKPLLTQKDTQDSPDVFQLSSSDDEGQCDNASKTLSQGFSGNLKDEIEPSSTGNLLTEGSKLKQSLTTDSSQKACGLEPKPGSSKEQLPKEGAEDLVESCKGIRQASPFSSANSSIADHDNQYLLTFSPLPLPNDTFDHMVLSSPGNTSVNSSTVREERPFESLGNDFSKASTSTPFSLGYQKHKSDGCLPMASSSKASAPRNRSFSGSDVNPDFGDSFLFFDDSPLAQPLSQPQSQSQILRSFGGMHSPKRSRKPSVEIQRKIDGFRKTKTSATTKPVNLLPCDKKRTAAPVAPAPVPFSAPFSPIGKSTADTKNTKHSTKTSQHCCSTPNQPSSRLIKRLEELGSNVKVLKTSNITPLPNFAQMTDQQLKDELAKYGVRPLGRKRAITLLNKIYDELHPVIEESSPVTSKPKKRSIVSKLSDRLDELNAEQDELLADKTLNESLHEEDILEESCLDVDDDGDEYDGGAPLSKDLEEMKRALLAWFRRDDNADLYNTLLALNPISFDEFYDRLSKSEASVARIPKKALMEILDRLHITFSLPADGWKRRREKKLKS